MARVRRRFDAISTKSVSVLLRQCCATKTRKLHRLPSETEVEPTAAARRQGSTFGKLPNRWLLRETQGKRPCPAIPSTDWTHVGPFGVPWRPTPRPIGLLSKRSAYSVEISRSGTRIRAGARSKHRLVLVKLFRTVSLVQHYRSARGTSGSRTKISCHAA